MNSTPEEVVNVKVNLLKMSCALSYDAFVSKCGSIGCTALLLYQNLKAIHSVLLFVSQVYE